MQTETFFREISFAGQFTGPEEMIASSFVLILKHSALRMNIPLKLGFLFWSILPCGLLNLYLNCHKTVLCMVVTSTCCPKTNKIVHSCLLLPEEVEEGFCLTLYPTIQVFMFFKSSTSRTVEEVLSSISSNKCLPHSQK